MSDIMTVRDRARFVGPSARGNVIARTRLDPIYDRAGGCVVRVVAPGGYGKSTLVAGWVDREERRSVAWVDLERIDSDPAVLMGTLTSALSGVADLELDSLPVAPPDGQGFLDVVVPAFGALVRRCETPFVLVLDDVHHLGSGPSAAVVAALAENMPPEATVVLCGRSHALDGDIARLRLHPGVVDVSVGELAFEPDEAEEMLTATGVDPRSPGLAALVEQFEGWPAGLRLAGLALRAGEGTISISPEDVGRATFVTDYVRSEWISHFERDDAAFLGEVACLGRFTGEMCDDVLGREGSSLRLRDLHREELAFYPLDRRDEWYRMHPLLAGVLASELEAADRVRWRAVHLEASRWWEAHGDIDLAFDHAMSCGDISRAETLVVDHAGDYFARGMRQTVRRWLNSLPGARVASSPALVLQAAFDAMNGADGARARYWCDRVARLVERRDGDTAAESRIWARADAMAAATDLRPASQLMPLAERAAAGLDGPWRAFACIALGGLSFLSGDDRAADALDEGVLEAQLVGASSARANCLAARSVIAEVAGEREEASAAAARACAIVRANRIEFEPTMAVVASVGALLEARVGNDVAARELIAIARGHLTVFASLAPWFNVLARLALADAALVIEDRAAAQGLLVEIEHHLRFEPSGHGAEQHLESLRRRATEPASPAPTLVEPLTTAELRVMQYLPTNLTLAEIATRLFVSRNTVKSHAAAIYRKLGATSRSEAVDAARRSGLVLGMDRDALD